MANPVHRARVSPGYQEDEDLSALGIHQSEEAKEKIEEAGPTLEILSSNVETYWVWSYCAKKIAIGMGVLYQPIEVREIKCVCELLEVEFEPWLVQKVQHLQSAYREAAAKRKQ